LQTQANLNLPSPTQKINLPLLDKAEVNLYIKRDDLIHPHVSGNKWRKLKYNILEAQKLGISTILTYGGPYSNHIYATAALGKLLGINTIGIIRGNHFNQLSHTLQYATDCGMTLKFLTIAAFKNRQNPDFQTDLVQEFGSFFQVPEGGANPLGIKGCEEIISEINIPFHYLAVACGTGTTFRGIVNSLLPKQMALGFPVLNHKGSLLHPMQGCPNPNWTFIEQYYFGGYAKVNAELLRFKTDFHLRTEIELDLVYTAKMMFGLLHKISTGYFPKNTTIIAIHTGGLQGNKILEAKK
jgi:1-aminocyclopropane-1-carboxylate deaminase